MLPVPAPFLNGTRVEHAELRAIHEQRRSCIKAATAESALDGPRLLNPAAGETCHQTCYGRDRDGSLLLSVTVRLPWANNTYVRWLRLVQQSKMKARA
jgi:hypothetical protein